MIETIQGEKVGTESGGDFRVHLLGPSEVVFRGREDKTRALLGLRQVSTQIGHGRWAAERYSARMHLAISSFWSAETSSAVSAGTPKPINILARSARSSEQCRHRLLSDVGCLKGPGHVVPLVIYVHEAC